MKFEFECFEKDFDAPTKYSYVDAAQTEMIQTQNPLPWKEMAELNVFPITDKDRTLVMIDFFTEVYDHAPFEFKHRTETRGCVVSPSLLHKGKFRTTYFDECGFSGHDEAKTKFDALKLAIESRYTVPWPGYLKKLSSVPAFYEGMAEVKRIQRLMSA